MKYRLIILFLGLFSLVLTLFISCNTTGQTVLKSKQNDKILDVEVDKLGNYYLIDDKNSLKKFDGNNKLLYLYSNSLLDKPAMIDVINPHKILVFYKQQQTLVFLDNTLTEISIISLDPNSFYAAAGMANDGNVWLFDSYYYKLVKIDFKGKQVDETFPYNGIDPAKISNNKIIERGNYVMVVDDDDYVFLFTNQGYFIRKIQLPGIVKPTILDEKIYYFNKIDNAYSSYDLKYKQKSTIYDFNNIKPSLVLYENNKFYILIDNKITIIPLRNEQHY